MKIITKYKHIWIALLAAIVIKAAVPPANGLTDIGVNVLAVLVPVFICG